MEAPPGRSVTLAAGSPPARSREERRLLAWLLVRLGVATLVLLAATVLVTERYAFTRDVIFGLDVVLFGSSTIGLVGLVRGAKGSAELLLAVDLMVTTALLWLTGAAASPLTFLYGLLCVAGAMVGGPSTTLWVAGASVSLFLGLSWSVVAGVLPAPPDQQQAVAALSAVELATFTLSNVVGIGTVAALATNLAMRVETAGGQLADAERAVAELTRRNVDIVRSLASGLVTTDLAGRIESVNPAAAAMLQADESALLGQPIAELLPLEDAPSDRTEGLAQRPDGSTFAVGFRQGPLEDADGNVTGAVITFQDLTEVNRLKHAAAESRRLAELGKLAASLAHEIRNPLTSISGSVELVRDSPAIDASDQRLLGIVLRETERLNTLVATMLRVVRPSIPTPTPVDLVALCEEIVDVARVEAEELGMRIELVRPGTPEGAQVIVDADGDQLRQVLWNLLRNALQASGPSQCVEVRVEDDGNEVRLLVRDRGRGLSEEAQAHLFEMFYSGRSHGIGLGLALVRQIVTDHGGRISAGNVDDTEGGALFCVTLPKRRRASDASAAESQEPRAT
ncbi:MAG: PAS domain-containing protein [Myxococcales bacterium]|nr:PAS domain-containing protein [Myxococcales bacterium]MCB9626127.1 PAS domain-containing protein [Sandaracinaceae bacterium]